MGPIPLNPILPAMLAFGALCAAVPVLGAELRGLTHVRHVAIRVVPGPARGNTGAAIIAAEQIRAAGFEGELTLGILADEDEGGMQAGLREMLPGYNPRNNGLQTLPLLSHHSLTVARLPWLEPESDWRRVPYPDGVRRVDLELWFGADQGAQAGSAARLVIASHLLGDVSPPTTFSIVTNALLGRSGSFNVRNLVGPAGLGLYGDALAADIAQEAAGDGGRRRMLQSAARVLRKESSRLGIGARHDTLSWWMEWAAAAGDVSYSLVYGLGFSDAGENYPGFPAGMAHLKAYLKAVRAIPGGGGRTVFVLQALGPAEVDALRAEGYPVANVRAGEPWGDEPAPGQVKVVVYGGLPRQVYLRVLAASDLPPIVEGDSSTSSLVAMGRPFLLASSRHNGAMRMKLAEALAEGDARLAGEFSNFSNAVDFDMAPFLGEGAQRAFQGLRRRHSDPLAVLLVRLAERLLADPRAGAGAIAHWQEQEELVTGSGHRHCRQYLEARAAEASGWAKFSELARNGLQGLGFTK